MTSSGHTRRRSIRITAPIKFSVINFPDSLGSVLPFEEELCRIESKTMAQAAVCYDTEVLCADRSIERKLFLDFYELVYGLHEHFNCKMPLLPFLNKPGQSSRHGAQNCYSDGIEKLGVRINKPARDSCDAGLCCNPMPDLCPLERIMFFISLSRAGIGVDEGSSCEAALDYFGGHQAN